MWARIVEMWARIARSHAAPGGQYAFFRTFEQPIRVRHDLNEAPPYNIRV